MSSSAEPYAEGTYTDLRITRDGQVATIAMLPSGDAQYRRHGEQNVRKFFPKHKELGLALQQLRGDNEIRVVVLTGLGDVFFVPPSGAPGPKARHNPGEDWDLTQGLARTLQAFIEIEKPVIADYHLGMGETGFGRSDVGVVPGDGGAVFVPLHMTPAIAKEYLFLARQYTGKQLAEMGIINRAVPAARLDAEVDELAQRLLKRSSYALAFAKRVVNRRAAESFNLSFDSAWAYEMVGFYMNMAGEDERGKSQL
jgi:enoyl-CoA hydratase/carnithine racemase